MKTAKIYITLNKGEIITENTECDSRGLWERVPFRLVGMENIGILNLRKPI